MIWVLLLDGPTSAPRPGPLLLLVALGDGRAGAGQRRRHGQRRARLERRLRPAGRPCRPGQPAGHVHPGDRRPPRRPRCPTPPCATGSPSSPTAAAAAPRRAPARPGRRGAARPGRRRVLTGPPRRLVASRDRPLLSDGSRSCEPMPTDARVADGARASPRGCSTRSRRPSSASASALMLVLAAVLAKGHVLLEDFPGLGKTLAARSFAQALGPRLRARPVHPRPAARRPDRVVHLRPAARRVRVPARAAVHRAAARRRDQPHAAQDPVGAARGDAGAPGHRRGRDLPAAGAVPRPRDRQPDRVRRHLPAARGPARPVPDAGQLRLPDRRRGVRRARAPARPASRRRSTLDAGHRRGRACWRCRRPSRR